MNIKPVIASLLAIALSAEFITPCVGSADTMQPVKGDLNADGYFTESGDMLGLYDGLALTERDGGYGFGDYPDTITLFKGPHERLSNDRAEVLEQIRVTVVHEIAHYFGMDEDQVDEMGYA